MPKAEEALAADRARALALTPVSRETLERLDRFVELLLSWQTRMNLIAPSTIPQIWTRHIADSLQLLDLAPNALTWIDLGSGAGFPGMVIACALADRLGAAIHLVESINKKANFLREAQLVTGAPAIIHPERIESFAKGFKGKADIVTARALAPLPRLLGEAFPLLAKSGAQGLFPKGQDAELELHEAGKSWMMDTLLVPSCTNPDGRIVVVRELQPRKA